MSKESMKINKLFAERKTQIGHEVTVRGWIRNHRKQKDMGFIELYDGSCFKSLQLVYTTENDVDGKLKALRNGACIEATDLLQHGYDYLLARVKELGIPTDSMWWYLNLCKYGVWIWHGF